MIRSKYLKKMYATNCCLYSRDTLCFILLEHLFLQGVTVVSIGRNNCYNRMNETLLHHRQYQIMLASLQIDHFISLYMIG